jgi:hypothetical protein
MVWSSDEVGGRSASGDIAAAATADVLLSNHYEEFDGSLNQAVGSAARQARRAEPGRGGGRTVA